MDPYIPSNPGELKVSDLAQDSLFIRWVRTDDPEADAFWTAWRVNHPEMEETIDAARSIVLALQFEEEGMSVKQIHDEWNKVNTTLLHESAGKEVKLNWFRRKGFLSVAAVLLLPAIFLSSIYLLIDKDQNENIPEVQYTSRTTASGQKLSITLSDGTKIKLNSDSEIKYPTQFSGDRREVILKGEAFFDVAHNDQIPFTVQSSGITVVVLGTAFNVSAYPESTDVKIALEKGKVKVEIADDHNRKPDIFLNPNEMIEINKSSYSSHVQTFDPSEITGWKDGYLYLGKADFNETVVKLERWFGVEFEIDSHFKSNPDWRFIGKFKDRTLSYILETISYPNLFKYKIEAQKVFIY